MSLSHFVSPIHPEANLSLRLLVRHQKSGRSLVFSVNPDEKELLKMLFDDWESDGITDHTGIVEKCENGNVYTIEGNSSDTCRTKTYPVGSSVIYGYGIPVY